MNIPKVTVGQIIRPLLALIFIVSGGGVFALSADAAPTTVYHYQLPKNVVDARQVCFEHVASVRHIPSGDAYITWWNTHKGTAAQREWTAAFEQCKIDNPMPGGKWNWDGMTLVSTEVIP